MVHSVWSGVPDRAAPLRAAGPRQQATQRRPGLTRAAFAGLAAVALALAGPISAASAATPAATESGRDLTTVQVSFAGGDGVTLHGTIVAPAEAERGRPGVVLVHGAGPAPQEWLRQEAEAFARAGIVTLIYDKRTDGYSLLERSYSLLADDALAAVQLLRTRAEVDPARVGLWGLSEGGWVAPLAASRSDEVAFVIVVGAGGVPPAQQEGWARANRLHRAGVSGSLLRAYPVTFVRLLADSGMFPEARYDPLPVLAHVRQPILAVWGEHDRVNPPAEGLSTIAATLAETGHPSYTVRILPHGDHAGYRAVDDGFGTDHWFRGDGQFADGYIETMTSWVHGLADGAPASSVDDPPEQRAETVPMTPLAWYESPAAQLVALLLFLVGFAGYPLTGLIRRLRRRPALPVARPARWLAVTGLATVLGALSYAGVLQFSGEAATGPVILGRPVPWLMLQLLAVGAAIAAVVTGLTWWRRRGEIEAGTRSWISLGLLLAAGIGLVPWALYWGLLLP